MTGQRVDELPIWGHLMPAEATGFVDSNRGKGGLRGTYPGKKT